MKVSTEKTQSQPYGNGNVTETEMPGQGLYFMITPSTQILPAGSAKTREHAAFTDMLPSQETSHQETGHQCPQETLILKPYTAMGEHKRGLSLYKTASFLSSTHNENELLVALT